MITTETTKKEFDGTIAARWSRAVARSLRFIAKAGCLGYVAIHALPLFAQAGRVQPEDVRWGETITITYDPKAPGARYRADEPVCAVAAVHYYDRTRYQHARLLPADGVLRGEMQVPAECAWMTIHFISLSSSGNDKNTTIGVAIDRTDGKPAKGSQIKMAEFSSTPDSNAWQRELELYPDSHLAWVSKWNTLPSASPEETERTILADIERLKAEGNDVDALYAIARGYLRLKREPEMREAVARMLKSHPTSELTSSATSYYSYYVFQNKLDGAPYDEIEKLKLQTVGRNPRSPLARDNAIPILVNHRKDLEKAITFATVEEIAAAWMREEPRNPEPYYLYGSASLQFGRQYDRGEKMLAQAIDIYLRGEHRFTDDLYGGAASYMLPLAYQMLAEVTMRQGNHAKALGAIKASQGFNATNMKDALVVEGKLWSVLMQYERAEAAYLDAHGRGSAEALDSLRVLYQRRTGSLVGFEEYTRAKPGAASGESSGPMAADFDVTALDGKRYKLSELRGKVVVLNFWFIGCAPCRLEMPGLNKLVAEYKGKDVVFLAFATDQAAELRSFLKTTRFDYAILPAASSIADRYSVAAYPTHVIIGRDGRISSTATGGGSDREKELRPLIDRALKQ